MSFLKKLSNLFSGAAQGDQGAFWVYARCKRCGEVLRSRVDLFNELSSDYEGDEPVYVCRKVLMGEGRCFQQVEVYLKFDQSRSLVDKEISGGEFISEEAYLQDEEPGVK